VYPCQDPRVEEALPTARQSPEELKRQLELERTGRAFLIYRDGSRAEHLFVLAPTKRMRIGRAEGADLILSFDSEVSRLHAEVENAGGESLLIDDGLSSNGSYVNGERVSGRRRLRSGDVIRFGRTAMVFRNPA